MQWLEHSIQIPAVGHSRAANGKTVLKSRGLTSAFFFTRAYACALYMKSGAKFPKERVVLRWILRDFWEKFKNFQKFFWQKMSIFANTRKDASRFLKKLKNFLKKVKIFWKKCWHAFFYCGRIRVLTSKKAVDTVVSKSSLTTTYFED